MTDNEFRLLLEAAVCEDREALDSLLALYMPLIFYFPHCLRLHHAHSGAGSGWHCWSVLFNCSYC